MLEGHDGHDSGQLDLKGPHVKSKQSEISRPPVGEVLTDLSIFDDPVNTADLAGGFEVGIVAGHSTS